MKSLLLFTIFITSFFIRSLRWLGILQQKEYRLDRILLFLRSKEGRYELFRFFPKKTDFKRTGLKRPKFTSRSALLSLIFIIFSAIYFKLFISFGYSYLLQFYPYPLWYVFLLILFSLIIFLIFIPLFVLVSSIPTAIVAIMQTFIELYLAKQKISKGKPKIIGITGSYGKTSTKLLLAHALEQKYSVFMTPKSFNTKYSVAHSIKKDYKNQEIAILEYAAYKKGEIKTLAKWFKPNFAIITGLAEQHLGLFGSLQDIIAAKSELVASLAKGSTVICNAYDEATKQICEVGRVKNKAKVVEVSANVSNSQIEKERLNSEGKLQFEWKGETIHTQLLGIQYRELVNLVIVMATKLGLSKQEIVTGLQTFVPNEKFMYMFKLLNNLRVIDDGNTSNPKGFSAVIDLSKTITAKKKVLVTPGIVDLGKKSREIHLNLARKSRKVFDVVVFVGESGKLEFQELFSNDFISTEEQFKELLSSLNENDLLVLEGRMPFWITKELQ